MTLSTPSRDRQEERENSLIHVRGRRQTPSDHLLQATNEIGHLLVFRFLARTIDDQTGRYPHDFADHDETIFCHRPSGFNQIHDAFAQPDEGSELN